MENIACYSAGNYRTLHDSLFFDTPKIEDKIFFMISKESIQFGKS